MNHARSIDSLPDGLWVNVGSGPAVPPGWTCIDGSWQARLAGSPLAWVAARLTGRAVGHWPRGISCRDVRRGLGLAPGSAAVIFSSHLIEHLHRAEAVELLRDSYRALTSGGVCRVITPDLAVIVDTYAKARTNGGASRASDAMQQALLLHPASPAKTRLLHAVYRRRTEFDHHKWVYDTEGLCALFREAGFDSPSARAFLDSDIPRHRLSQVETADRVCQGAGICVEARK